MPTTQKIPAGEGVVTLSVDDKQLKSGLQNSQQILRDFGSQLAVVGQAIAAAGAAMLAPFVASMKKFTSMGVELTKLSEQTGISATALGELSAALGETGESLDTFKGALTSMAQFMDSAAKHSHDARRELSRLGLSFAELQSMSPEDQFSTIAHKIGEIEDPARQTAAALAIFGSKGADLLPLIKDLDKLRAEAVASGMAPSKAAIEAATAVGEAMRAVGTASDTLQTEVGAAFASVSKSSLETMKGVITGVTAWVKKNQALITQLASIAKVVAIAGTVISAIGIGFFAASTACSVLAGSLGAVSAVLAALTSPIALVGAAVIGGIAYWAMYTDAGKAAVEAETEFLGQLLDTVKETFGGISDALTAGDLELAGKIAITGLQLIFVQGMDAIAAAIGGVWGDTLGKLTSEVMQGDLQGAWGTAVLALSAIWDQFCSGIWKAFSGAMKGIVGLWERSVKSLAKTMLSTPWLSKIVLAGTGIDMDAEQKRKDALNAKAKALGLPTDDSSVLDDASKSIDQQVGGSADSMRSWIDKEGDRREGTAKASGDKLQDHVSDGSDALSAQQQALKEQLAAMKKDAANKVAAAAAKADDDNNKRKGAASDTADSVAGTFSAASLSMMGGGNVQEKLLDSSKEIGKLIGDGNKKLGNLEKAIKKMGVVI